MKDIKNGLVEYYNADEILQMLESYKKITGVSACILDWQGSILVSTFTEAVQQSELSMLPIVLSSGEEILTLLLEEKVAKEKEGEFIRESVRCYVENQYLMCQVKVKEEENIESERIRRNIEDTLEMIGMGTWSLIISEDGKQELYADKTMNQLIDIKDDVQPSERYEVWKKKLAPESIKVVEECLKKIIKTGAADVEYEWIHETLGRQYVRGGGILDTSYRGGVRIKGWHQDITEQMRKNITIREADKAINVLSSIFTSVWTVDLEDRSLLVIKEHDNIVGHFSRVNDYSMAQEIVLVRELIEKEFLGEYERYLDYDWLASELQRREVISWEFRLVDENWERLVIMPLRKDEKGNVKKILFSVQKITEEKEKELENQFQLAEANKMAKLQLETITSGIPGGFKVSRNDGKFSFKYASEEFAAMLGYSVEEIMNIGGMYDLVHPDDVEGEIEKAKQMYKRGNTYVMKYRIRCKDGSYKFVMDRGRKVFLGNGDFEHWCLILDIDEQERLNKLLHQERKQYREALIQDSIFFFHVDLNDGYIYEDVTVDRKKRISELYDITFPIHFDELGSVVLKHISPLMKNETDSELITTAKLIKRCEEGNPRFEYEYYVTDKKEYQRMDFYMRKDEETGHIIASIIGRNITKQKTEMEKAYQDAKRANEAKTEFLSRMSHDIRTPMNGILGMARIAKESIGDCDKVKDSLEKIQFAGEQLEMLINDVLDMSRLESGRTELTREGFEVGKVFWSIEQSVRTMAEEKNVSLIWGESSVRHNYVIGSPLHIQRVVLNVISNAIKYNKIGGSVNAWLEEKELDEKYSEYTLVVKDTGIGMGKDFMNHMFEPFSREHTDAGTNYQGTGLGMAIMKELVDLMNGNIQVESQLGEGTTVRITVPMEIGVKEKEIETEDEIDMASIKGMTVLLVEDNPINAEIACHILRKSGVEVVCCEDGKQAYETFLQSEDGTFDAIVMDIMMPVMDGLEATKQIRNSHKKDAKTIPIIAMTANAFTEDVEKTKEAGMNAHLSKPLHPKNLIRVLNNYYKTMYLKELNEE